ncbi:serine hydrolase domain-containing protein [Lacticaseibacillus zhaodongensis]|uniref:serine hydrolase domain-containing protein n=1 Tax=Lacticaseibacillus zhaodongensis TaxID=2668065 RepID=UPI0012D32803|nr:serine hydrolase domain-containing protein [Lacticaseibacillus zhaodongensis]
MSKQNPVKQHANMRIHLILLGIVILALAVFGGVANYMHHAGQQHAPLISLQQQAENNAHNLVAQQLKAAGFSGNVLVVRHGRTFVNVSRGLANARTKHSNTARSAYEIDSVQKSLTAALVMQEVERGRLRLSDRLARFYPQVPGSRDITIRELLDMTSGLSCKRFIPRAGASDSQIVAAYCQQVHYHASHRGTWDYQPVNYNLLSGILERVSGMPYAQLLQKRLLTPLHLADTHLAYVPGQRDATGYGKKNDVPNYQGSYHTSAAMQHAELGTGQLFTTTSDLYRVEAAIVSGRLLGQRGSSLLHRPGSVSSYGGGLYNNARYLYANGFGYGFSAFVRISHDGKNAVIMLANADDSHYQFKKLADQLAERYVR